MRLISQNKKIDAELSNKKMSQPTLTQKPIDAAIKKIKRQIKILEDELCSLQVEKLEADCPFKVGKIVYVYEYRDSIHGGFWHPVKVKRFFIHEKSPNILCFTFTPNDKRAKSLMRWRQASLSERILLEPPSETE